MAADSKDPLSFFANDSSGSESEEESETAQGAILLTDKSYYTPTTASGPQKLPSPDTLFSTITQPRFLTTHIDPHHVNWDKLVKNADTPTTDEPSATESRAPGKFVAIPPPKTDEGTSLGSQSEISKGPVRYVIVEEEKEEGEGEEGENVKIGVKRSSEVEDSAPASSKKQKVETFREKEKRKRDLGMSSRGKNFVEEEKRILRESFEK